MRTLAKGTNNDCIFKLIKVLINTQQADYEAALAGDTADILDVASQIETERSLFGERDRRLGDTGDGLDLSRFARGRKPLIGGQPREKDILIDMKRDRGSSPHYVDESSPGRTEKTVEYEEGSSFPRSSQFDFLLDLANPEPASRESRRQQLLSNNLNDSTPKPQPSSQVQVQPPAILRSPAQPSPHVQSFDDQKSGPFANAAYRNE